MYKIRDVDNPTVERKSYVKMDKTLDNKKGLELPVGFSFTCENAKIEMHKGFFKVYY